MNPPRRLSKSPSRTRSVALALLASLHAVGALAQPAPGAPAPNAPAPNALPTPNPQTAPGAPPDPVTPPLDSSAPLATVSLTLESALAQARASAPLVGAAGRRVREAEGGRVDAEIPVRDNMSVSADGGPSVDPAGVTPRFGVEVTQSFDLGGGVTARVQGVDAAVEGARANGDDVLRLLLRDVATSVERLLWLDARIDLATRLDEIAQKTLDLVQKQLDAGEVSALQLRATKAFAARASGDRRALEAERATEAARLRSLLGLRAGTPLVITGDLADRARFDRALLMPPAGPRADALAYEAQAREAEAESRAADAMRAPKLVVGLRYEHEEPEVNSVFGLLGITLPFFDYGQGIRAKADARAARARGDAIDAKNRALVEQSGAADTYRTRVGAAEALEASVEDVDSMGDLGQLAFEKGEIAILPLLALRREIVSAQQELLDRQLEAALAGIDLETALGGMR